MEWKEIAQVICSLTHAQCRLALLYVLGGLADEQEIDRELFERVLEIAQTWPKEER